MYSLKQEEEHRGRRKHLLPVRQATLKSSVVRSNIAGEQRLQAFQDLLLLLQGCCGAT